MLLLCSIIYKRVNPVWTNYHTHSNYCDGKERLSGYCDSALRFNMPALGFSSHAPLPFESSWCMKRCSLLSYLDEIRELKDYDENLQVYSGLEVDYLPGLLSPNDFHGVTDYTIGSIHFVDAFDDGTPWEIDSTREVFTRGLDEIFNKDIRAAVRRYFSLTREMLLKGKPTILGHLDKIKIQNTEQRLYNERSMWYRDEVMETISTIAASGCIVEINTRGMYQGKTLEPYPDLWIIKLLAENHIPVTLSSDAHHPKDLVNCFSMFSSKLHSVGIDQLTILKDGSWTQLPFNGKGITIA